MKALLIKDFRLIKNQRSSYLQVAAVAVGITVFSKDSTFMISYMAVASALLTLGTISYDEFDNGYAYLFSLPIPRKTYVLEKYLFCGLTGSSMCLLAAFTAMLIESLRSGAPNETTFVTAVTQLFALCLILAATIPFRLKFGPEKSRVVMIGTVGMVMLAGFLIARTAQFFQIELLAISLNLIQTYPTLAAIIISSLGILTLILSIQISIRILERKEF